MTNKERIDKIKDMIDKTLIDVNQDLTTLTTKGLVDIVYTLEMIQQLEERLEDD